MNFTLEGRFIGEKVIVSERTIKKRTFIEEKGILMEIVDYKVISFAHLLVVEENY